MVGSAASGTLGLLAGYALRTSAVLALALLAAAASKRRPAAFRHFVLSFALIGLVLLPLLSLVPVGWKSPLVPSWMAVSARPTEIRPAAPRPGVAVEGPDGSSVASLAATAAENGGQAPRLASWLALPALEFRPGGSSSPPLSIARAIDRPAGPAPGSGSGVLDTVAAALWSAGLAILILRLLVGLTGAMRMTTEGTPLSDPAWRLLLERFMAFVSLRRKVRLKSHPEVLVPLTWGWRRPVVLLPGGAEAWTREERSSALFHELSHIKRADFLVMMLVRVSLALFWWNPLCWIVYRELLKEQEIACDALVLRAGIRPSTYAANLLAFGRSAGFRWDPSAALLGMLGRSSLQERLAAILRQKITFKEVKMKTKITLALALVLAVAFIGTARPADGREKLEATAAIAETALAAPSSLDVTPLAAAAQEKQEEKAVVQEKEKEKEKVAAGKKILVTAKEGGKKPIVITITEGGAVKRLVLDKPLTITKIKDGNILVLTSEGKEIEVLEGEPLHLEIEGAELMVLKEGEALEIDEGKDIKVIKKIGEPGKIHIIKEGKVKEGGTDDAKVAWVVKEDRPGDFWTLEERSLKEGRELLEKVRRIREQVEAIKAKKLDLAALEESLKKLEADLEAKEKEIREFTVVRKIKEGEPGKTGVEVDVDVKPRIAVRIDEKGKEKDIREFAVVRKIDEGEPGKTKEKADIDVKVEAEGAGMMSISVSGEGGEEGKKAFERAIDRLKAELPDGCKLVEQAYDAEAGTMSFKIAFPKGEKPDEDFVRKLVDLVQK